MNKGLLFTSPTCPSCGTAKERIKNYEIEIIDITKNVDKIKQYRIMSVPQLIVVDSRDEEIERVILDIPEMVDLCETYLNKGD